MRCIRCKNGTTAPGRATLTLDRDGSVVVIRGVPAEICGACGEEYMSGEVADRAMAQAEIALATGAAVHVAEYLEPVEVAEG